MTTREKKLLQRTALLGLVVTLGVLIADHFHLLAPLESWLGDRRIRYCQYYTPAPSSQLLHLDVGDQAIEVVGRWPWDRSKLAMIIDEIHLAGAKALAFDVILSDPQEIDLVKIDDQIVEIDHDKQLASAVKRFGNVIMPIAFEPGKTHSKIYMAMYRELLLDLELKPEKMIAKLHKQLDREPKSLSPLEETKYLRARSRAMYERLFEQLEKIPSTTIDQLSAQLLPNTAGNIASALTRQLGKQYHRVLATLAMQQHSRVHDTTARVRRLPEGMAPIASIGEAAGATGFVYYEPDEDGAVRQIVLWIDRNGYLYPQLGLALACNYLGIDIHDVEIYNDRVVIPRPADAGGTLAIPVFARLNHETGQHYGTNVDIPWFGKFDQWTTMYDPAHEQSAQHLPITQVWSAIERKQRIENNNKIADNMIRFLYSIIDPDKLEAYQKNPPTADNGQARLAILRQLAEDEFYTETLKAYKEDKQAGNPLDESGLAFLSIETDMAVLIEEIPKLQSKLEKKRKELVRAIGGRAVLIGWTATGSIADFVPTPLHSLCPGVVVHGVMFNSILNGEVWLRAESWVTATIILLLGLITIAAVCLLSPMVAWLVAVLSAGVYLIINGIFLFDYHNLIVGAAGPLTVVATVWGGCTLFRFIIERAERSRITARFSSYVDPVLVNYVIEHPEKAQLDGEEKELTVVFTDLQGFTTISELLGTRTVGILNEYMGLMTNSIREHSGYVNKFLGDGIMFFYGAPLDNPQHAIDAMATSVRMQELMVPFNKSLAERNLPEVFVRIGVGTGNMIVGDAGSADASDYTVLGDIVNSAARLESANKQTGTWIMCNERCHELLEGRFLCRTIGELQVVGKSEGMKVYNPLDWADKATDAQREIVRLFDDVVNAYTDGSFKRCIEAINVYEKAFEPYKLSKTYRGLCEQYIAQPPEEFLGRIVLSSK